MAHHARVPEAGHGRPRAATFLASFAAKPSVGSWLLHAVNGLSTCTRSVDSIVGTAVGEVLEGHLRSPARSTAAHSSRGNAASVRCGTGMSIHFGDDVDKGSAYSASTVGGASGRTSRRTRYSDMVHADAELLPAAGATPIDTLVGLQETAGWESLAGRTYSGRRIYAFPNSECIFLVPRLWEPHIHRHYSGRDWAGLWM